jgi:hypothetical protein
VGGDRIFGHASRKRSKRRNGNFEDIEKITGARFDHFEPVIGATLKGAVIKDAHAMLYGKLRTLLQSL